LREESPDSSWSLLPTGRRFFYEGENVFARLSFLYPSPWECPKASGFGQRYAYKQSSVFQYRNIRFLIGKNRALKGVLKNRRNKK